MRTSALAATREESREDPRNSPEILTFFRKHERGPEVLVVTWEEPHIYCRNSRKTGRFSSQCEMRPFPSVRSREKAHLLSWASKGSLTPLMQLKKFPQNTRLHSSGTPSFLPQLKKSPVLPSSSWHEDLLGASTGDPTHDKGHENEALQKRQLRTWGILWTCTNICPKTWICLSCYFSTTPMRGCPWPPFSGKKN